MTRPFTERWGDMRDNCDQALKLAGMLPSAVRTAQDDPDFFESVMTRLSDQLCCLDACIGDEKPEQLATSCRLEAQVPETQGFGLSRERALDEVESNLQDARDHLFTWMADADNFADGIVRTRLSELAGDIYVAIECLAEARRSDR